MKRIGIDVGGTNTDAAMVDGDTIVATVKVPTSEDVMSGVRTALDAVSDARGPGNGPIDAVMIGTTHFTNAIVERARLERIAVIRIALPSGRSLPPLIDWPDDLRRCVDPMMFMVHGGHEYDGRALVEMRDDEVRDAARAIRDAGITAIAISALFSPLTSQCERRAADLVREILPNARITLSHTLGRIGLLERENVAALNATLQELGRRTVKAFDDALATAGIDAPFFLTQNDGTVALASIAAENPVHCFASGPTNSMRGAAFLTGENDAMVVDVGGTTSDIGCLSGGFPREANNIVHVGGVRTLFRMPDLLPIALGGGTIVDAKTGAIGPRSVGYRITQDSLVFGGETLTTSDIGVAAGLVEMGDHDRVKGLDPAFVSQTLTRLREMVADGFDRMKISAESIPLIAVGGGAFLVSDTVAGASKVIRTENAGTANALGAAMAQVSGEVDQVFSRMSRENAIAEAESAARTNAVAAGAREETLSTLEIEDIPIAYLRDNARRVRVRVIGDIDFGGAG
ncbi:hydantoinase/oxoprolinase N-terminal domain-containing protein [Pararhizobium mangrovi]|uniref:Hydantoinase/oxoprolinase family protein n=1 Tax=Pararhizobium mangrovi TaxID=2590452 RepID=A0A506UEC8_9HYPH|nr:hydantoinase/oxoprolinase family protein [Pararhizobium mangrovi]TPW31988.1 hydantoinase/oxoprolinase family protein [Pararhizobium mangrovi]